MSDFIWLNGEDDEPGQGNDPSKADMPTTPLTDPIRERLFRHRNIIISGEVNQRLASSVTAQLLAMSAESDEPINIFINSQGGHVEPRVWAVLAGSGHSNVSAPSAPTLPTATGPAGSCV